QRMQAEATTSGAALVLRLRDESVAAAALPESIVHYVVHTRESVILDDASTRNPFSEDPHIREHHARSILCLPLINQAKLIGVLYLENTLTPHVFNPPRIAVLKLLASQAAISLENTRLYRDLEERERRYRQVHTELAPATRVATMGQLSASIAHEVNQPITAAVTNAQAALRWLQAEPPHLDEVRLALGRIVRDGNRSGDVITRVRALL